MSTLELIFISIGLAMDAFAVSVCKGLSVKKANLGHMLLAGLYFGLFQAMMPVIGYFAGTTFADAISSFDHWVIFVILGLIGANMIKESFDEEKEVTADFSFKTMILLAIATSIDALAVGVSFALMNINILFACIIIGIITFVLSAVGIKLGNLFGNRFQSKAEFAGGLILIIIGLKVLLEHLNIISF